MPDPLSFSASIATILALSATVVEYLSDVRTATQDRQLLLTEVTSTSYLLGLFRDLASKAQWGEPWSVTVKSLGTPRGPLEQFKLSLERLATKLKPVLGLKKAAKALFWPFEKREMNEILLSIERQKTMFGLALQNDHVELTRGLTTNLEDLSTGVFKIASTVTEIRKSQQKIEDGNRKREILGWMSSLNFAATQKDILGMREAGTGQWLLDHDVYLKWITGATRTVWCLGGPGVGKTVLTSIIIDSLESISSQEEIGVAYIFCNYKEGGNQTARSLMSSLLQQLLQKVSVIPDAVIDLYQKSTQPSLQEVSNCLKLTIKGFRTVFIVIDALDECLIETREALLNEIQGLQPEIQLLVTSRPNIKLEIEELEKLDIQASVHDIKRYVKARIQNATRLRNHIQADPSLHEVIVETITKKSQGMFLLAQLHVNSLAKKPHRKAVRLALEHLPKELDATYDEAMRRIDSQDDEDAFLARKMLGWLSYAMRPLSPIELRYALAIERGSRSVDEDALIDISLLVSICAGLVIVDQETDVVRLVHFTTQEYFERHRAHLFPAAQHEISEALITYLLLDDFEDEGYPHPNWDWLSSDFHRFPLTDYAVRYWVDHARGIERSLGSVLMDFLLKEKRVSVLGLTNILFNQKFEDLWQLENTGLILAVYHNLKDAVCMLLEMGVDVNEPKRYGRLTALHEAIYQEDQDIVSLLLENGANIEARTDMDETPFYLAMENGSYALADLLMKQGADIKTKAIDGKSVLHVVSGNEDSGEALDLLLRLGIEVNSRTHKHKKTPLHLAARVGQDRNIDLLLKYGADIESEDSEGRTALHEATVNGFTTTVDLLIKHGANVKSEDNDGKTALHLALEFGRKSIMDLLLTHGADINCKTREEIRPFVKCGRAPLWFSNLGQRR